MMTTKNIGFATCLLSLIFAMVPAFAQDSESKTDGQIALEEAAGAAFEKVTDLPTDATSLILRAAEGGAETFGSEGLATVVEAVTASLGPFIAASASSSTAGREIDEVYLTPQAEFVQRVKNPLPQDLERVRQFSLWEQQQPVYMRPMPASTPSISPCHHACNR